MTTYDEHTERLLWSAGPADLDWSSAWSCGPGPVPDHQDHPHQGFHNAGPVVLTGPVVPGPPQDHPKIGAGRPENALTCKNITEEGGPGGTASPGGPGPHTKGMYEDRTTVETGPGPQDHSRTSQDQDHSYECVLLLQAAFGHLEPYDVATHVVQASFTSMSSVIEEIKAEAYARGRAEAEAQHRANEAAELADFMQKARMITKICSLPNRQENLW